MNPNYYPIYSIIASKLGGESVSEAEEVTLNQWLEFAENREEYASLEKFFELRKELVKPHNIGIPEGWPQAMFDKPRKKRHFPRLLLKYAAVLIPIIAVSVIGVTYLHPATEDSSEYFSQITPGMSRAILVTDGGEEHLLSAERGLTIKDGITIENKNQGIISYETSDDSPNYKPEYHTLKIERGGEYRVILPDGTTVWLNSESELRYPSRFSDGERRVALKGEGYFEVVRDERSPFIVETGAQDVTVLGTEFNVEAYGNGAVTTTTLVNGSVKVRTKQGEQERILKPGEQARLNVATNGLSVQKVDVSDFTAWRDGFFVFEGQTFEQVLTKISRWYDVEFSYENKQLDNIVFKGSLPKHENLLTILELIEMTSPVKFQNKGETIYVKRIK